MSPVSTAAGARFVGYALSNQSLISRNCLAATVAPNPWLSIWLTPRLTIRRLLDGPPRHREHILAIVVAFVDALNIAVVRDWGDRYAMSTILLIALATAPIRMVFYLYLYPALAWVTGRWLGGQGSIRDIRIATAWSFVPVFWLALLWIPQLVLFGDEVFKSEAPTIAASQWLTVGFYSFLLLEAIGTVWFVVVFLAALAEAQRVVFWRAIANVVLVGVVFVLPLYFGLLWFVEKP